MDFYEMTEYFQDEYAKKKEDETFLWEQYQGDRRKKTVMMQHQIAKAQLEQLRQIMKVLDIPLEPEQYAECDY